ncbi:TPA: hypothetical protein IAA87_06545 [Candidatus Avigastranaerophilus faecigallinarum]|nr:hypothetical protein [Candidatus Avigastranaerophilus faecigallinarum]
MYKYPAIFSFLIGIIITVQFLMNKVDNVEYYSFKQNIIDDIQTYYDLFIPTLIFLLIFLLKDKFKNNTGQKFIKIANIIIIILSILYFIFIEMIWFAFREW